MRETGSCTPATLQRSSSAVLEGECEQWLPAVHRSAPPRTPRGIHHLLSAPFAPNAPRSARQQSAPKLNADQEQGFNGPQSHGRGVGAGEQRHQGPKEAGQRLVHRAEVHLEYGHLHPNGAA